MNVKCGTWFLFQISLSHIYIYIYILHAHLEEELNSVHEQVRKLSQSSKLVNSWLCGFNGISTFVGYLMPIQFFYK